MAKWFWIISWLDILRWHLQYTTSNQSLKTNQPWTVAWKYCENFSKFAWESREIVNSQNAKPFNQLQYSRSRLEANNYNDDMNFTFTDSALMSLVVHKLITQIQYTLKVYKVKPDRRRLHIASCNIRAMGVWGHNVLRRITQCYQPSITMYIVCPSQHLASVTLKYCGH